MTPTGPVMVVVCGYPASGKTSLAREVARGLRFPLIAKDDIKEAMADVLGAGDMAWSHALGQATYAVMFRTASAILGAGSSIVLESNFEAEAGGSTLRRLLIDHQARAITVVISADPAVLLKRYRERADAGERHPVHLDHENLPRMETTVSRPYAPPDLPGHRIDIDGEDFDPTAVLSEVRRALAVGPS